MEAKLTIFDFLRLTLVERYFWIKSTLENKKLTSGQAIEVSCDNVDDELNFDSLEKVEVAMKFEDGLGIKRIEDCHFEKLVSVKSIESLIVSRFRKEDERKQSLFIESILKDQPCNFKDEYNAEKTLADLRLYNTVESFARVERIFNIRVVFNKNNKDISLREVLTSINDCLI